MILTNLNELPSAPARAVIINVGTKLVTTLALLSALRYAGMPVLVIDCESQDGSWDHFSQLMKNHEFDLLAAPLKTHGITLDWLFRNLHDERVLLIDSDIEINSPEIMEWMKRFIGQNKVFGCGFTHGPCWLHDRPGIGYYQERMWIPLTFLKTAHVRQALEAGMSFAATTIYNDFAPSAFLSKRLASRFRHPSTQNWKLSWLNAFKNVFYGHKPCYVFCDTGAMVYQYLKYRKGLYFAGFPAEIQDGQVTHFHGVTRGVLNPSDPICTHMQDILQQVRDRLKNAYGIEPCD